MRTSAHSHVQALGLGLLLGLGLCLPPGLQAALPDTLNYQGRVRLTSGAAVADSTTNNVAFALYTQATGGTAIWTENQSGVTTTAGLFNVVLGSVVPLTLPFDQPYWLGINFNGDGEMSPRTPLTMAPYAFRAKYADSAAVAAPLTLGANVAGAVVEGSNFGSSGVGVRGVGAPGFNFSTGMLGEGGRGVVGRSTAGGGVGVLAEQGSGSDALRVSGNARFEYGSVTFAPGTSVDFSGATVYGLAGVPNPLVLGNTLATAVLTVSNQGAGEAAEFYSQLGDGLRASSGDPFSASIRADGAAARWAVQGSGGDSGAIVGSDGGDINTFTRSYGVGGTSGASNGAGVYGQTASSTPGGVGVVARGPIGVSATSNNNGPAVLAQGAQAGVSATASDLSASAVYGLASFTGPGSTYGVRGVSLAQAGYGVHGENLTPSGIGVYGTGGIGVFGEPSFGSGTGVEARQGVGTWALSVSGAARFQHGPVDFTGVTVTGLAMGVANPLFLGNSLPGSVLTVSNTGSGRAVQAHANSNAEPAGHFSNDNGAGIMGVANSSDPSSAGVVGQNTAPGGVAVYGSQYNSGTAVYGEAEDGVGVQGSAIGAPSGGVGVRGSSNDNAIGIEALATGADSIALNVNSSGGHAIVAETTAFGKVALSATAQGTAVYGHNISGGGFIPAALFHSYGTNHAVQGRNLMSGSLGILAGDESNSSTGVYGRSAETWGYGVHGESAAHQGVRGTGPVGVAGVVTASGQTALLADSGGIVPSRALHSIGDSLFELGRVSFTGEVDFSAATVTGLALGVAPPLTLSAMMGTALLNVHNTDTTLLGRAIAASSQGGPVLEAQSGSPIAPAVLARNTTSHDGIHGIAANASGRGVLAQGQMTGLSATATDVNFGRAIYAHANAGGAGDLTTAELRRSGNGTGAALRAYNTGTAGGAPGIQAYSGGSLGEAVRGIVDANGNTGYGVLGRNEGTSNVGAGVYGVNNASFNGGAGVRGDNSVNIGVLGIGRHGVVGRAANTNGAGVTADWNNSATSLALKVSGPARFDMGSTTFAAHVDFSGATVTGLALGVSAPLSLSLASAVASPLHAFNSSGLASAFEGGTAQFLSGTAIGLSVTASSTSGRAILARSFTSAEVVNVFNPGFGDGIRVQANGYAIRAIGNLGNPVILAQDASNLSFGVQGEGLHGVYGSSNTDGGSGMLAVGNGVDGLWARTTSGDHRGAIIRNLGVTGTAIALSATSASANGVAGYFQGATGLRALGQATGLEANATAVGGIGILAQSVSGPALRLSGTAIVDSAGGTLTVASYVSFTAGTNLGGVSLPISGSASVAYPGAAIQALNTASGHGVLGRASLPGVDLGGPLAWGSTLTAGVQGFSDVSMSAGVIGLSGSLSPSSAGLLGMGLNGSGVIGYSFGAGQEGGGFTSDNGIGVKGSGVTGVAAVTSVLSGTALTATNSFPGGLAARFQGRVLMDGNLSGPGDVLAVTQNQNLAGMNGIASYNNASASAAVRGVSFDGTVPSGPGVQPGRGLEGIGPIGVVATTNLGDGIGLVANVSSATAAGTAILAINEGLGSAVNAQADGGGTGVRAVGQIGVQAESYQPSGIGLQASANGAGSRAIHSFGNAVFDPGAGPTSVTFNTHVHFADTVTGISGGVSAPLGLTNSTTAPTLYLLNNGGGRALAVSNSASSAAIEVFNSGTGNAIYAANTGFGGGVFGDASSGSQAGIYGRSSNAGGYGVRAQNTALSNGLGLLAEVTGASGGGTAIRALGQLLGVSAVASANNGAAILGRATATGASNARGVVGSSAGQSGTGVAGITTDPVGQSTGVYGESAGTTGIGVRGLALHATGANIGVWGETSSTEGYAVYGITGNYGPNNYAFYGVGGNGVFGSARDSGAVYGVRGDAQGAGLSSAGVVGQYMSAAVPTGQPAGVGVIGVNASANGWAMQASAPAGIGLVAAGGPVGVSVSTASSGSLFNTAGGWISARSSFGDTEVNGLVVQAAHTGGGGINTLRGAYFNTTGGGGNVADGVVSNASGGSPSAFKGTASSSSGWSYGGDFTAIGSAGNEAVGVRGLANSGSTNIGVLGRGEFGTGYGVVAEGRAAGLSATTTLGAPNGANAIYASSPTWETLRVDNSSTQSASYAVAARHTGTNSGVAAVWGEVNNGGSQASGVYGRYMGSNIGHGVRGHIASLGIDGRAGVSADNTMNSVLGNPSTALDIDGGIVVNAARVDAPAGSAVVGLGGCAGSNPAIASGSFTINSNQILANSLILLTPVAAGSLAYPVTARITSQSNGQATVHVHTIGQGAVCPGIASVTVNYMIINQR
jgi:hypothetical protein